MFDPLVVSGLLRKLPRLFRGFFASVWLIIFVRLAAPLEVDAVFDIEPNSNGKPILRTDCIPFYARIFVCNVGEIKRGKLH